MTRRGRKPSSPNGEPKQRYTVALRTDIIAFLRRQPNAAAVIESKLLECMSRAEGPRDFGDVLPDTAVDLRTQMADDAKEFLAAAAEKLLGEWISEGSHSGHVSLIVRYVFEDHPEVTRYVCTADGQALTLTEVIEMRGNILHLSINPQVSQTPHCSCYSSIRKMIDSTVDDCLDCGGTGWLRRY